MKLLITFLIILLGIRSYSQNDFYTSIDLNYKVCYPIDYNENVLKNWPINMGIFNKAELIIYDDNKKSVFKRKKNENEKIY